ncbi:hypothetical protein [Actinomadura hibisca]|uniref:hypothetical protein n=1 Tax=Actinomadura hibisca TaxID=68565 RepID=UPI00082B53A6|nr:hypothetical protein [Actinomadura hibisca]
MSARRTLRTLLRHCYEGLVLVGLSAYVPTTSTLPEMLDSIRGKQPDDALTPAEREAFEGMVRQLQR